jgi:translation initiation factor RLI1
MQITKPNLQSERSAIKSVLSRYVKAVENENMELYGRAVDHNSDMVNFGTDASERIVGWDALKKAMESQFATLEGARISVSDITVSIAPEGRVAWATSLWAFRAKMRDQTIALPVRCTWVLEKRKTHWVIVHFHKSVGTTA